MKVLRKEQNYKGITAQENAAMTDAWYCTITVITKCKVIIIIIIVAFKGAVRELPPTCTLKWLGHNRVQFMCNTSSTYQVQHVMCHLVRRDSSGIKFDRVEIAFN